MSRANFFKNNPQASAWAALDHATNEQLKVTPGAIKLEQGGFSKRRAIIIGAGVSGLTTAYELLAQKTGMEVTILEAHNRTGGRCLSLRTGDTLTEDKDSDLFDSEPGQTQTVRFTRPIGDSEPYLNAGPGRIPSAHKRLLTYLKKFGVEVEVYVMNSDANLVQMKGGPGSKPDEPMTYRRLDHNTRGWLAQLVFEHADELVKSSDLGIASKDRKSTAEQLKRLMISFGELGASGEDYGRYRPTQGEDGFENGRTRAGYSVLPGVDAGKSAKPIEFKRLLQSKFWEKTRFYQPVDFLWQPTLFQPVGGMDRVQHAFSQQVAALGGTIHLNSPVKSIDWDARKKEFVVKVQQIGTEQCIEYRADYCFCNVAMPFLREILSPKLQNPNRSKSGLSMDFKRGLHAVYKAQFGGAVDGASSTDNPKNKYVAKFLACTTKVGWQADRALWQGGELKTRIDKPSNAAVLSPIKSEVGVVPIFGGISWTDHDITQIWYPSNAYHDSKGVLTGAYNFAEVAYKWGKTPIQKRLKNAKQGAARFGDRFAAGLSLDTGLAIAWQNMPYIKGGWAQWHVVDDAENHFNKLSQGSGIYQSNGELSDPVFFVIGDQISSLPGWQEGAIAASLNALSRMQRPDLAVPHLTSLPDTRLIVEGV